MRLFPKETWSYAVLLVILFGITTIAVWQTILFLETCVPETEIGIVTALLWTLTLGFMLIAGAFGLWSIQFAAGAESRRRISAIVTSMDYIQDGLLAIDHHDRITGCNTGRGEHAARSALSAASFDRSVSFSSTRRYHASIA